ncbi:MAG: hypothetical protein AAGI71_02210 [Bacteroidota bacterium]
MTTALPGPVRRWSSAGRRFERALLKQLGRDSPYPDTDALSARARTLLTEEQATVSDAQSQMLLVLACSVLAACQNLVDLNVPPSAAKQRGARALVAPNT